MGEWYEIARLDHSFERGLSQISADYSQRDDGGVRVINRGYDSTDNEWKDAEGKAYFVEDSTTGYFKATFFWPFYGSYVIFELDTSYEYAFVSGSDNSYLWFLSRKPEVDKKLINEFEAKARQRGFDVSKLIYVDQSKNIR